MQTTMGEPVKTLQWSSLKIFNPTQIENVLSEIPGVYIIRYRDEPEQWNPASMLYVGCSERCIRSSLMQDYCGMGNEYLPDFVGANPLNIYFHYAECLSPKRCEACLLVNLNYPICN